ncbi:Wilms tumor protein 1 interacting protein [Trichuris trichiura]|uniref:Wilms tumor protein 1 interacting protein n=1 Tax=Trichuris trichiura TaxID=36087 RepID=A0A077ZB70_TRITR|nr:Wilms tumor protein 1 interacting protein [Trichuris trichiura]
MDAEELIKHDHDTKQWLADIESFRQPPPMKKLMDDMRDVASLDVHSKNIEDDFLAKLQKFQLSESHPYSGNDRVQTGKQLATVAKLNDLGMLSLASSFKRKEKISKHQAKALREEITKLTRPTNPFSSLRSDSSGYDKNSSFCTSTEPDDESTTSRTSFDHVKCSSCCVHFEFSREQCTKSAAECALLLSSTRSQSRHEPTPCSIPATAPMTEKTRSSAGGHQTKTTDKEMSPIMGIASNFSNSHTLASQISQSVADIPCSKYTQCHLCYMQDGLKDGLQHGSPKRTHVTLSREHIVSLNKRKAAVPSPTFNEPPCSIGVDHTSVGVTSPLLETDDLRDRLKKCSARRGEIEKKLSKRNTAYGHCALCHGEFSRLSDAVKAHGYLFHRECFISHNHGSSLHGETFYESDLGFCCKEDDMYPGYREFAEKCHSCGNLILAMLLQAGGKCFHPQCFRCCKCKVCLDGVPFTVDNQGRFFCVQDYHTLFAPNCAKCRAPITPVPGAEETVRVVAMQRDYHIDCYVCEGCGVQLTDEPGKRCYPLEEHLLCRSCNFCWTLTGGTVNPITDV